jgi:hypothetical protein
VKIYIEGGGEGQILDTLFRQAWSGFFRAAGLDGRMPRVVRGKGRKQAFDMFTTALGNRHDDEFPLLLVDSEGPVKAGHSAWQHLKARDDWEGPAGAVDDHVFLMVQVMETWFLADRKLLRRFFDGLRETHLHAWPVLEDVAKADVLNALDRATAGCKKSYAKGRVSYELLAQLDPKLVENACPSARRLLEHLRTI